MTSTALIWSVGFGGAALFFLAYFCFWSVNLCIKQFTERTHERFRQHLAHDVEEAIKVFREGMCEQIVLQGKKSDSLASLYSMLIDLLRLGKELAACCGKGEPLQVEKRMRAMKETCTAFSELFQKESLHFPEEFCSMLNGFLTVQQETMQGMERELYRKDSAERGNEAEIRQYWLRLEDRITVIMEIVRKEFHRRNQTPGNFLLNGLGEVGTTKIVSG